MSAFTRQPGAYRGSVRGLARAGRCGLVWLVILPQFAAIETCRAAAPHQERARAPREARGTQPFELVRALEQVQDQVVLGNADARAKMPKLLGQIGAELLAAEPSVFQDPRNLRAVLVYAASGGQPRVVRRLVDLGVARDEAKDLLDGMLAYVEGRDNRAEQLLLPVDAMTLPAPLAGHLALVQANLVAHKDPRKASQLLARARVLAPGTLVEEAALRKEVFLADQDDDLDAFTSLSSQYMRRFDRSAYAANFRRLFEAAVTRFGLTSDSERFARLETVLALLEPEEALDLMLSTGRAGLVGGKVAPARQALAKAATLAKEGTVEAIRARLYAAAVRILSGEIEAGLADLDSVEIGRLTKSDAALAEAVRRLASNIRSEPALETPIGAEPQAGANLSPEGPEGQADAAAAALIRRAETALGEIGPLLERSGF